MKRKVFSRESAQESSLGFQPEDRFNHNIWSSVGTQVASNIRKNCAPFRAQEARMAPNFGLKPKAVSLRFIETENDDSPSFRREKNAYQQRARSPSYEESLAYFFAASKVTRRLSLDREQINSADPANRSDGQWMAGSVPRTANVHRVDSIVCAASAISAGARIGSEIREREVQCDKICEILTYNNNKQPLTDH